MRDKIFGTKKNMEISNSRIFSVGGGMVGVLLWISCCLMAGCGKQDEVLVIPMEQSTTQEAAGNTEEVVQGRKQDAMLEPTTQDSIPDETQDRMPDVTRDGKQDGKVSTICVYVCGAVASPGVVELPEDSRVADALEACGGFAENARRDVINLAEKLADGEMVRIPGLEEEISVTESARNETDGKININTADVSQLVTLSGIGESRAQDIITYRDANGAFASTEDIMKVPGIKESIYSKICDKITVK